MKTETRTLEAGPATFPWQDVRSGAGFAWPIVIGYAPVAFAFGVLAQKVGMSLLTTLMMSAVVFAGSSQFVAVGLLSAGAGPLTIIATTFVVNLRHMLMSAALAPHMRSWPKFKQAIFAYELTDESFAVHSTRFAQGRSSMAETFAVNALPHMAWTFGSWLGFSAGWLITDVEPVGLDYALSAMFIALLVGQVKNGSHILVALVSGGASVALALGGVDQFNVILATVIGASLGLGACTCLNKQ